jgi:hypothetical protein
LVIAQCYQLGLGVKVDPLAMLAEAKRVCDTLVCIILYDTQNKFDLFVLKPCHFFDHEKPSTSRSDSEQRHVYLLLAK